MKTKDTDKSKKPEEKAEDITRKEALKKAGKYAAVTAVGMILVLSPKKALASSPAGFQDW